MRRANTDQINMSAQAHYSLSRNLFCGLFAALLFMLPLATPASSQAPTEYSLGVQDKVLIKVGRWQPAEGTFQNWDGFGGEQTIGADGKIYLALVGAIEAAGRTPPVIAEEISLLLQARLGLDQPPATTVEIVGFGPVFIVGAVNNPGSFPYVPQLTVLQAVSIAGGHLRTTDPQLRTEREALTSVGTYETLRLQGWSAMARIARLKAELAGAQTIETPEELKGRPIEEELMASEQEILTARLNSINSSKAALVDLKELLRSQIAKLTEEVTLRGKQILLAREELANVTSLKERGLVVSSRQRQLSATVTELEAKVLTLDVAKLQAEQQLNKAVRDELDIVNVRRSEVVTELQKSREQLDQLRVQLRVARDLYADTASRSGAISSQTLETTYKYMITRRNDASNEPFEAVERTLISPGDTIQVHAIVTDLGDGPDTFPILPE
ncbi:MAG: polysaccharide biosynthesis/export family protein [Stappiaceae bacterium]